MALADDLAMQYIAGAGPMGSTGGPMVSTPGSMDGSDPQGAECGTCGDMLANSPDIRVMIKSGTPHDQATKTTTKIARAANARG